MDREQKVSAIEDELLPVLVGDKDPDAYVVIQVGDLSSLMRRAWTGLDRDRRQVTPDRLAFRVMRMLMTGDFIVDTKFGPKGPNSSDPETNR